MVAVIYGAETPTAQGVTLLPDRGVSVMDFYDVLEACLALLQQHKRLTYRALQAPIHPGRGLP